MTSRTLAERLNSPKYALNAMGTSAFFVAFGVLAVMALGYSFPEYRGLIDWIPGLTNMRPHASNLILSATAVLLYGLLRTLYDARWLELLVVTFGIAGANVAWEMLITADNTPDAADAVSGVIGATACLIPLWVIKSFGVRPYRSNSDPD